MDFLGHLRGVLRLREYEPEKRLSVRSVFYLELLY